MSLCTTGQYRAKYIYCDLPDEYLNEWLLDAEDVVNRVLREADADAGNLGDESAKTCERVVRDMVHRAIGDGSSYMNAMQGSTQLFSSGDGFSQTVNMGNGFADLFIRKQERKDILAALRDDGLTDYGGTRAACAAPSFGVFDGE